MNNSFFSKFTPKETKFFPMLNELSGITASMSKLVVESLGTFNYDTSVAYHKKIKELEKQGDKTLTQIFNELHRTFITPFDREDIHSLANMLDDIADYINNFSKRIVMYKPKSIPNHAVELSNLLLEATTNLSQAVQMLSTLKDDSSKVKE
jgi:uncharacterized protein Yka (UPF0111/DUF47 family)